MTLDGPMGKTKPVAYVETSVVSYLTARPSRDVVVAAYQQVTREWWRDAPDRFDLALNECAGKRVTRPRSSVRPTN